MSSGVAVARISAPKQSSTSRLKKPLNHPKYTDMIRAAITSLKERGGSSRQAILKYILSNYNVASNEKMTNNHLKFALRAGVKSGRIRQAKGSGASGSFKLGEVKAMKKPKAKKTTKKPSKSKSPKKRTSAKSVKKSPKKSRPTKRPAAKKAKSPKKAKKPRISSSRKSPSKSKARPRVTKKAKSKSKSKSPKKYKARK